MATATPLRPLSMLGTVVATLLLLIFIPIQSYAITCSELLGFTTQCENFLGSSEDDATAGVKCAGLFRKKQLEDK